MKKYPGNPGRANANESVDRVHVALLTEKIDSLTRKLQTEESKFRLLYNVRAAGMADFRKLYEQKVKLRKGFCIAMLVILFEALIILQLILNS